MKTVRAVMTLGLSLALLVGLGSSLLIAQTAPAASATSAGAASAPAASAPAASPAAAAAETFSKEQLEQLVAPIALYSDALLMQILMAATYPLEIVEADRYMKKNPGIKDKALEEALKNEDWDPSVKSLCTLPDVLKRMSENLDWTQDLGDAFLGQKDQLLDTVQIMRGKAHDSGNLKTTEQQVVTVKEEKIIVIESPSPEVVYVPTYAPTAVYGGWSYPSYYYPPMYPTYPPGAGLISFGIGMAVGGAIWGDCDWGWGHNDVNIDVDRYNNFNRNTNVNHNNLSGNRANWNHDASHRGGVNYKNSATASQYGAKAGTNRVSKGQAQANAQARGYSGANAGSREARASGAANQQGWKDKAGGGQGAAARDRQGTAGQGTAGQGTKGQGAAARDRQGTGQGAAAGDRAASAKQTASTRSGSGGGDRATSGQKASGGRASSYGGSSSGRSAYSGSSKPSYDRAASSRGSMSRGTSSYGGGGARGGGGSRGGGGGRRR